VLRKLTVIFLLLLAIMGLSGILVQENLDSVTVSAKYIQVELGRDGNLSKVTHNLGRAYLFYVNDNDGFDIYDSSDTEISTATPTYTIAYGNKLEDESYESVKVIFTYPNGVKRLTHLTVV